LSAAAPPQLHGSGATTGSARASAELGSTPAATASDWLPVSTPPDGDSTDVAAASLGAASALAVLEWGGVDASTPVPARAATSVPATPAPAPAAAIERFHPATLSALQLLAAEYGDE